MPAEDGRHDGEIPSSENEKFRRFSHNDREYLIREFDVYTAKQAAEILDCGTEGLDKIEGLPVASIGKSRRFAGATLIRVLDQLLGVEDG